MSLPLEEFKNLPSDVQTSVCSVAVNYSVFHYVIFKSFQKAFDKDVLKDLFIRLIIDFSGIEWDVFIEFGSEEQKTAYDVGLAKNDDHKQYFDAVFEKAQYCSEHRVIKAIGSPFHFLVENYNAVPMEFKLRDLYASFVPFIRWIRDNILPSEEKDRLEILIESLEGKYLLTF